MPEAHDPIQQQLIAARRNQILDAAAKVFADKGFHRATIKDIARMAGIADGTIYNYFANKSELLIALLDRLNETEHRAADLAQGLEQDLRSFFVTYLRHRISLFWPNFEIFRAVLPELLVNHELRELYYRQVVEPTLKLAERHFEVQIAEGRMRPVDVPLAVRSIAGSLLGLLVLQMLGDEQLASRWEELPEVLATLLVDGLTPPHGLSSETTHRS